MFASSVCNSLSYAKILAPITLAMRVDLGCRSDVSAPESGCPGNSKARSGGFVAWHVIEAMLDVHFVSDPLGLIAHFHSQTKLARYTGGDLTGILHPLVFLHFPALSLSGGIAGKSYGCEAPACRFRGASADSSETEGHSYPRTYGRVRASLPAQFHRPVQSRSGVRQ